MEIQQTLQSGRPKSDITFYKAFMELTRQRYYSILLNFLKALQFAILIPSNILKFQAAPQLIDCMTFNLSASILGMFFSLVSLFSIYRSVTVFLNVADQTRHTIPQERTTNLTKPQFCYSETVYVADQNIKNDDIDEQTKKVYDGATKNSLIMVLKMRYSWYRNGDNLYSVVNFTSMIYSIIVLSTVSMSGANGATEANLIIYVIIVGLSEITLILVCILLALSPLICIGLCIFCCCCKTRPGDVGAFINVPMKDATMVDIVNAGGDCAICYQSINEKQKVYVLLCSDKHVFHCECLKHWTKVKNTCPICRQEIPMADQPNEAEPQAEAQPSLSVPQ